MIRSADADAGTDADTDADTGTDAGTDTDTDTDADTAADADTDTAADTDAVTDADTDTGTDADTAADTDTDAGTDADPDADPGTDADPDPGTDADPDTDAGAAPAPPPPDARIACPIHPITSPSVGRNCPGKLRSQLDRNPASIRGKHRVIVTDRSRHSRVVWSSRCAIDCATPASAPMTATPMSGACLPEASSDASARSLTSRYALTSAAWSALERIVTDCAPAPTMSTIVVRVEGRTIQRRTVGPSSRIDSRKLRQAAALGVSVVCGVRSCTIGSSPSRRTSAVVPASRATASA
ncbi:MAG: hypothetical protein HKN62_01820 [Phycisphaerales bacterium]|nr:hypothetical protein [Phycisphaerales bacterium]